MNHSGARLKEERLRLDLSQTALGEIGGVTMKTQLLYEKGERKPDIDYLAAVADAGVNVYYVITGKRGRTLPSDEAELLTAYRNSNQATKYLIMETSKTLAKAMLSPSFKP